jgi:hypothetical protein
VTVVAIIGLVVVFAVLTALLIPRRQQRGTATTGWQDLLVALAVWIAGATVSSTG